MDERNSQPTEPNLSNTHQTNHPDESNSTEIEAKDSGSVKQAAPEMEKEVELLKLEALEANEKHRALNRKFQDMIGKLTEERLNTDRLNRKIENLGQSKRKLQDELKQGSKTAKCLQTDKERLESQMEVARRCIQEMEEELEQAKLGTRQQAKQVQKAAEKVFQTFESGQWQPDSDGEVSDKLHSIDKDMHKWCRTNSRSKLDFDNIRADDVSCLKNVLRLNTQRIDLNYFIELSKQPFASKLTHVLLTAALSNDIYTKFFNNPFFFEERDSKGGNGVLSKIHMDNCKSELLRENNVMRAVVDSSISRLGRGEPLAIGDTTSFGSTSRVQQACSKYGRRD
jgi:hypothetical protein